MVEDMEDEYNIQRGKEGPEDEPKGGEGYEERSLRMQMKNRLMMSTISGQNGSAMTGIVISYYTYLLGPYRINRVETAEEFGKLSSNHENIAW